MVQQKMIKKRDGREVPFDSEKITNAIMKAFEASHSAKTEETARDLTRQVLDSLNRDESIAKRLVTGQLVVCLIGVVLGGIILTILGAVL